MEFGSETYFLANITWKNMECKLSMHQNCDRDKRLRRKEDRWMFESVPESLLIVGIPSLSLSSISSSSLSSSLTKGRSSSSWVGLGLSASTLGVPQPKLVNLKPRILEREKRLLSNDKIRELCKP